MQCNPFLHEKNAPSLAVFFQKKRPSFSKSYLRSIEEVVLGDLSHFGPYSAEKISSLKCPLQKAQKLYDCVLDVRFEQEKLTVSVATNNQTGVQRFPSLFLRGRLAEDRVAIHKYLYQIGKKILAIDSIINARLLFTNRVRKNGNWIAEIWCSDYDGKNAKPLTKQASYATHPTFFPQENAFLFVSYAKGRPKIMKKSFDKPVIEEVISLRGSQSLPALSQDGSSLLFVSDAGGRPDLFFYSFKEGKPRQLFSYPKATQASSTFHPNNRRLAFVSDKEGAPSIYLLDIPAVKRFPTPTVSRITKKNRHNTAPSWSSDGKKLAYSAKTGKTWQIWIYDFLTGEERQLTFGDKNMENPKWAKDNIHIVCNSDTEESAEIYMINMYKKTIEQISSGVGCKKFPSLEPKKVTL
ncbi:MAG: hypothetical protein AAGI90_01860 [Chlamydiota bacterium]